MVHTRIIAVLLVLLMPLPGLAGDNDKELRKAAEKGDKTKVQEALAKGANVNAADKNGVTALMIAAEKGYAEIVQVLLEAGADLQAQNKQGATAAILAEMSGHPDIAKRLAAGVGDTVGELPCASVNLAGRKEKEDEQVHFFAAPLPRVREVLSDSMMTIGFVVTKEQGNKAEARRKYPELGGGGAGNEELRLRFEEAEESGLQGVRVFAESKKHFVGKLRQKYWASVVLDQAACLLELLGPRTDAEVAAADAAMPDHVEDQRGQAIALPDGSPIKLRLRRYLFSKDAKIGDRIAFEIAQDVVVDGAVVIKKGAIGWGTVTEAEGSKSFGRNAELGFTFDHVKGVNGQNITIRSSREKLGGTSGGKIVAVVAIYRVVGAFLKGKNVGIRAGTEFVTFVNGDQALKLKPEPPQE